MRTVASLPVRKPPFPWLCWKAAPCPPPPPARVSGEPTRTWTDTERSVAGVRSRVCPGDSLLSPGCGVPGWSPCPQAGLPVTRAVPGRCEPPAPAPPPFP